MHSTICTLYYYSSLVYESGKCCDRFTVGIPYCGTQIECKFEIMTVFRISWFAKIVSVDLCPTCCRGSHI